MRTLTDIMLFAAGAAVALSAVALTRVAGGAWGVIQLPLLILVLAVFFLPAGRIAALALGIGLGLDTASSYPFFTWTVIVGGTALAGWWMSKNVLTNRALPSLILLAVAMRVGYFLLEVAVSRLAGLVGGTVWYRLGSMNLRNAVLAFLAELAILAAVFLIHVRVRGEKARMLTHL